VLCSLLNSAYCLVRCGAVWSAEQCLLSCGMWCCVVCWTVITVLWDVVLCSLIAHSFCHCRCRQQAPPKCGQWTLNLHSATSQKTVNLKVTTVITSNLTHRLTFIYHNSSNVLTSWVTMNWPFVDCAPGC
jgi:hypothetical protein